MIRGFRERHYDLHQLSRPETCRNELLLEELFEAGLQFRWVGLCRHGYLRCHAVRPLCGSCTQHTRSAARSPFSGSQATCPPSATAWPPLWGPSCSEQVVRFRLCSGATDLHPTFVSLHEAISMFRSPAHSRDKGQAALAAKRSHHAAWRV